MTYTCNDCKRTFTDELQYELHRDTCSADDLVCEVCGERFAEDGATRDGWHYTCPNDGCDGSGIGGDLHPIGDFSVAVRQG